MYADPDEFAQEMVKMINEKEFRSVLTTAVACSAVVSVLVVIVAVQECLLCPLSSIIVTSVLSLERRGQQYTHTNAS